MVFSPRTETYVNVSSLSSPYNITVTKPTGTVDGDILFCWIGWYAAVTIDSVPSGWNLLGEYIANTDRYALYYKVASGEPASWVWSFSATAKVRAVCSCYTGGDFRPLDTIDVVSNSAYRTSDANCIAASMNVASANSPLIFWGGCYSTTTKSFTKPSVPTSGWVEDDDDWKTAPDMATEVCSFIWSGSGATGAMSATISATLTAKHAFAVALKPLAHYTKTFSVDALLKKTFPKTFSADGFLKKAQTKAFSADAVLQAGAQTLTKTFTVDAVVVSRKAKAFAADAFLRETSSKAFSVDAVLVLRKTKGFSADAFLKKAQPKTFAADAVLVSRVQKAFSADAFLEKTGSKGFSVDAVLVLRLTKAFSVDAFLEKVQPKAFSADAVLKLITSKEFSVDAVLKLVAIKQFTVDAILQAQGAVQYTKTFLVDAYLVKALSKAFSADALLKKAGTKGFLVDAVLQSAFETYLKVFSVDALLQKVGAKSFSADAVLLKSKPFLAHYFRRGRKRKFVWWRP